MIPYCGVRYTASVFDAAQELVFAELAQAHAGHERATAQSEPATHPDAFATQRHGSRGWNLDVDNQVPVPVVHRALARRPAEVPLKRETAGVRGFFGYNQCTHGPDLGLGITVGDAEVEAGKSIRLWAVFEGRILNDVRANLFGCSRIAYHGWEVEGVLFGAGKGKDFAQAARTAALQLRNEINRYR